MFLTEDETGNNFWRNGAGLKERSMELRIKKQNP